MCGWFMFVVCVFTLTLKIMCLDCDKLPLQSKQSFNTKLNFPNFDQILIFIVKWSALLAKTHCEVSRYCVLHNILK